MNTLELRAVDEADDTGALSLAKGDITQGRAVKGLIFRNKFRIDNTAWNADRRPIVRERQLDIYLRPFLNSPAVAKRQTSGAEIIGDGSDEEARGRFIGRVFSHSTGNFNGHETFNAIVLPSLDLLRGTVNDDRNLRQRPSVYLFNHTAETVRNSASYKKKV